MQETVLTVLNSFALFMVVLAVFLHFAVKHQEEDIKKKNSKNELEKRRALSKC